MDAGQSSEIFGLLNQIEELQERERNLVLLLSQRCPGVHEEARTELAATRMLLQAAEQNLDAVKRCLQPAG